MSVLETVNIIGIIECNFRGRITVDLTDRIDVGLNASALIGGDFESVEYGIGPELGVLITKNLRAGVGYNFFGFRDDDLDDVGYTNIVDSSPQDKLITVLKSGTPIFVNQPHDLTIRMPSAEPFKFPFRRVEFD